MSRHRNFHNLTEDDYYDDYYDDDEDHDWVQKAKEAKAAKKKKPVGITPTKPTTTPKRGGKGKSASGSTPSSSSSNTATASKANTGNSAKTSSTGGITVAPPGFGRPTSGVGATTTVSKTKSGTTGGVTSPPPGFGGPPSSSSASSVIGRPKNGIVMKGSSFGTTTTAVSAPVPSLGNAGKPTTSKVSVELQEKLKAQKSRLTMVILGHVDAGKSTLMGQVLVQMGIVQKRVVTKYEKEATSIGKSSFALAWIMDEDPSERERGVTIDVATKQISTPNHDVTVLDAPGHADYVPAMITGAASADVGLLVVAATPGEFESGFGGNGGPEAKKGFVTGSMVMVGGVGGRAQRGGQTKEHVVLARSLGVSQLIVAVNKLDCADPPWSKGRFEQIRERLMPFLMGVGFDRKRVRFVPISGLTGVNVKERVSVKGGSGGGTDESGLAKWYSGPSLMEAINNFHPAKRNIDKPLRFIVTDMYTEGKGVTTRGRMVQGMVSVGDKVSILPVGDEATVTRVDHGGTSFENLPIAVPSASTKDDNNNNKQNDQSIYAERLKIALAGDAVDLYLTGVDAARLCSGNVLSDVDPSLRPPIQRKFRAQIAVMDPLSVMIISGIRVQFHMHSLDIPATVSKLVSKENKKDKSTVTRPRMLTAGAKAVVEIKLDVRVCVEAYTECRALGRFALRYGGDTIAVGVVQEVLGHS